MGLATAVVATQLGQAKLERHPLGKSLKLPEGEQVLRLFVLKQRGLLGQRYTHGGYRLPARV